MKKPEKPERKYLSTAELCILFPITKQTAYNWRKEGMPYYGSEGPGKSKFYIESEVIEWLKNRDNADKVKEAIDKVKKVEEIIDSVYPKAP